jgi:hypothetical protein
MTIETAATYYKRAAQGHLSTETIEHHVRLVAHLKAELRLKGRLVPTQMLKENADNGNATT